MPTEKLLAVQAQVADRLLFVPPACYYLGKGFALVEKV
jgi:hypothetical protein